MCGFGLVVQRLFPCQENKQKQLPKHTLVFMAVSPLLDCLNRAVLKNSLMAAFPGFPRGLLVLPGSLPDIETSEKLPNGHWKGVYANF